MSKAKKAAAASENDLTPYHEFLAQKAVRHIPTGLNPSPKLHETLFPFQRALTELSLRRGRSAIFAGTGLGKTPMQVEWGSKVAKYSDLPVLIVAPLAVSAQTIAEAQKLVNVEINFANGMDDLAAGCVSITNYGKIHRFDYSKLGGIALDESSILKNETGATRMFLVDACANIPFRLGCTATPSPNDYVELGNHAEFLGIMTMQEMLAMFFVHDGGETQNWRLKKHAEKDFWEWMASWCVCIQKPSDIGFDDSGYILPELRMHEMIVESENPIMDGLFTKEARTMSERRVARKGTISERVSAAAELAKDGEQWCFWCNLNDESAAITKAIPGAVEIKGGGPDDPKEKAMLDFAAGKIRVLVTKASIAGFGMNWQSCHKTAFVGLNDSFEQVFQAVRRFWRFGQKSIVDCHMIISDQEGAVLQNIKRKEDDAERMYAGLAQSMAELTKAEIKSSKRTQTQYNPRMPICIPEWIS